MPTTCKTPDIFPQLWVGISGQFPCNLTQSLPLLCFPRFHTYSSDVELLGGIHRPVPVAPQLLPQIIPRLRRPLPGELYFQEFTHVLLSIDQEGVRSIEAN